jgi:hypothetical protein
MLLKGMSPEEFTEILQFVQKFHGFAKANSFYPKKLKAAVEAGIDPELAKYGLSIKYVRCDYDSRTGDIWGVTFDHIRLASNSFVGWGAYIDKKVDHEYETLFDLCMAYLKGDYKPGEEHFIDYRSPDPRNDDEKLMKEPLLSLQDVANIFCHKGRVTTSNKKIQGLFDKLKTWTYTNKFLKLT